MTLIEIIVAMALISIVSIIVLTLFSSALIGIIKIGDESIETFTNQESIEDTFSQPRTESKDSLIIKFSGDVIITIKGEYKEVGDIEIFLPK